MEESKVPGEKTTCLSKVIDKLYNILYRVHLLSELDITILGTGYIGSCKSNYNTITTMTAPHRCKLSISGQRPVDCDDIDSGRSGVYTIYPKGSADPMKIFYFIQADGGG